MNPLAIQRIKLFEITQIYSSFYLIPESESEPDCPQQLQVLFLIIIIFGNAT